MLTSAGASHLVPELIINARSDDPARWASVAMVLRQLDGRDWLQLDTEVRR